MKKILLASTILVGTAGFAAAENANFTWSGSAYVGVGVAIGVNENEGVFGQDLNGDGDTTDAVDLDLNAVAGETSVNVFRPEITSSFTAGMMTTTDMGLEAGASITVDARGASFETDHTDGAFAVFSEGGFGVSNSSVYLSGDWGKLAVAYDDDGAGTGLTSTDWDMVFTYSHSFGDFSLSAYYTIAIAPGGTNGDLGAEGTYSFGDYSLTLGADYDNSANTWSVTASGEATFMDFTLGASATYDNGPADWDWMASADYATGPYSIGVWVEDDGTDDAIDYGAKASYDLGGGVSVDAAYIYDNDTNYGLARLGVSMSF